MHKFKDIKPQEPPERRKEWYLEHLKDLKYEDINRLYYLLRSSEILPFDIIDNIVSPD